MASWVDSSGLMASQHGGKRFFLQVGLKGPFLRTANNPDRRVTAPVLTFSSIGGQFAVVFLEAIRREGFPPFRRGQSRTSLANRVGTERLRG